MKHFILSFFWLLSFNLFADDIISEQIINSPIIISANLNQIVNTGRHFFINQLVINAEGIAQDSMIEVLVNGIVKGTIYAPGRDPEYVVTVKEVTNQIEFRHKSGAKMKITTLTVFRSEDGYDSNIGNLPMDRAAVARLANNVINLSRKFEVVLNTRDFETYILPEKIVAGQLYAVASAHGGR